jgi:hypothetical protein
MAGVIDFFRYRYDLTFSRVDYLQSISLTHIMNPIEVETNQSWVMTNVLDKIWLFRNSNDIALLVNSYIQELSKTDQFENGVLNGLEWSLNEVMDNVLQHSNREYGFVMGQVQRLQKEVAFCIFDSGQGIFNSLKDSLHRPRNQVDALTLCIKEGVTRDASIGQGNGMWGLHQVVKYNRGILSLASGSAIYTLKEDQIKTFGGLRYLSYEDPCTIVDFQLDYKRPISIADALKFNGTPYLFTNLRLDNLENDQGEIIYQLSENSSGTGTRQAGERLRNDIVNIYKETKKIIIIDFAEIAVTSSSFADEFIGKLVVEFGFYGFNNIIRLKGMNELIQTIVQRAVSQRMAVGLS